MITVNELFSGIGAQRKALERLGFEVDVVGVSEIDKFAIQSYEAIFGKTRNYGDICTTPRLDYADLWTYSFPCQDISVAGKQQGINENTRSGLLYQVQRLLEVAKDEYNLPKYLLLENVKNLVGKKFKNQFDNWILYLDELGYNTYWQVLNAKNYGVPQNRERVFAISIRKDLNQSFEFPKAEELTIRLKDVLEDKVDDKFYLSNDKIHKIQTSNFAQERKMIQEGDICSTLLARDYKDPKCVRVVEPKIQQVGLEDSKPVRLGNIYGEDKGTGYAGNVWDKNAISPTLTTMQGGNREPMILENKPMLVGGVGEVNFGKQYRQGNRVYDSNAIAMAVLASPIGNAGGHSYLYKTDLRIRKLTPLECWRLMGFDDEDFYKAQKSGVSNSQLYKQAGNSIVVNVLEKIFKNLLGE
jgi:DNA (cytosine-5)-methyltransferase 1